MGTIPDGYEIVSPSIPAGYEVVQNTTEPSFDYADASNYGKAMEGLGIASGVTGDIDPGIQDKMGDGFAGRGMNIASNVVEGVGNAARETGANVLDMIGGMVPGTEGLWDTADDIREPIPKNSIGKLVGDAATGGAVGKLLGAGIDTGASLLKKTRIGGEAGDSILNVLSNAEAAIIPGKTVAGARKGVAGVDNIIGDITSNKYQGINNVQTNTGISEALVRRGLSGTPNAALSSDIGGTIMKLVERVTGGNSPYTQELASQVVEVAKTTGKSIDESLSLVMRAWRDKAGGKTVGEELTSRIAPTGAAVGALLGARNEQTNKQKLGL